MTQVGKGCFGKSGRSSKVCPANYSESENELRELRASEAVAYNGKLTLKERKTREAKRNAAEETARRKAAEAAAKEAAKAKAEAEAKAAAEA